MKSTRNWPKRAQQNRWHIEVPQHGQRLCRRGVEFGNQLLLLLFTQMAFIFEAFCVLVPFCRDFAKNHVSSHLFGACRAALPPSFTQFTTHHLL